jgi:uncharacterized protein YjbI with pentapeptide repeats
VTRPDVQAALTVIGRRNPEYDRQRVNLTGADLARADLTDGDLTGANLTGARLTEADLTNASGHRMRQFLRAGNATPTRAA